ncbi:transcription factor WhiB [Streptomyces corchorusii]|uniref:Transcriptional regulator WhiB n=2 Tax=Streptomyces TaxID=1883 RepID=A0A101PQL0_STRCK|nr:WhiB family transcriptional regulator [Streptomyces corchorusii]KUN15878.1 transcription factor WhiB [Streptomyces corchorusii]
MDWVDQGLCRAQPDRMFAEGAAQNEAKAVCAACPVRLDCLAYALDHREEYGVWGAMTERERRALLRRRPAVTSWAEIFRAAAAHPDPAPVAARRGVAPAVDRDASRAGDRTPYRPVPARGRRPGTAPAGLDR